MHSVIVFMGVLVAVRASSPSEPIIVEEAPACFRRLLIGKKLADHHIRRSLPSTSSHTCEEECASEQQFVCEGFNYRLDTGSCELTEVPISRLDLGHDFYPDRDYDYYERDRNSGPECGTGPSQGGLYGGTHPYGPWGGARPPSSAGSQGTVGWYGSGGSQGATGWYGSGGSQGPTAWYGSGGSQGPTGWYGSGGSQGPTAWYGSGGSQRPLDWYGSGGLQRPTDWHGSGGSQRPTDWYGSGGSQGPAGWYGSGGAQGPTGWYGSGGSYGGGQTPWGSYGRPQGSPGPWNRPPQGGGAGWGAGGGGGGGGSEVGFHKPPPPGLPPPPPSHNEECFLRVRTGFRLDRRVVQLAIATRTLHECEEECARQGHCNSFSFRYSLDRRFPNENCYMSERYQQDLDAYTELVPDRNYDIYVKNERACSAPGPPSFPVAPDSECFIRVRSGQRLDQSVMKDSLEALSIGECELACLNARHFTCRVFSYRYGPPVIGAPLENCQLTDWPFLELDPRRQLIEDIGYELYERGSYGHGCEVNRLPPPDDRQPPTRPLPKPSDEICYVGYGIPAELLESAVRSSLDVPTEQECKKECSRARDSFLFFCTSLSFRTGPAAIRHPHSDSEPQHNCLLSDIDQRDLRPGLDYEHDQDTWLFAWDSLNARCDLGNAPGEGTWNSGGPANGGWDVGGVAWGTGGGGRPPPHYIPGRWDVPTWQRFTVSGRPCLYGTECQENREAGFWSCELEGGDVGAWDYCCRPGHQCGYSEGFNYPWCYVGNAVREDQWRPCSDQYYPYPQEPHPHTGGADLPYSYEGYGPPRYWPVAYLHREVPPNASQPDPFLQQQQHQHLDGGGLENYVDSQRTGYGKQLLIFPLNSTTSKFNNQVPKQNTVKVTDKKNSADDVLVLEVVDEKEENPGKKEEQTSTTVSPKLQPRFASTQKRGLVARDVGHPGWSWRGTSTTIPPRVVQFRRRDNTSALPRTTPTKI